MGDYLEAHVINLATWQLQNKNVIELFIIYSLLSEINISIKNHWQPLFNFETNLPFCSHFFHHQALRHQVIARNWLLACFSSSGNYIQILGHKILWFKQVEQPTQSEKNFGGSLTIEQYIWQHNYHHHCCNNITISHKKKFFRQVYIVHKETCYNKITRHLLDSAGVHFPLIKLFYKFAITWTSKHHYWL